MPSTDTQPAVNECYVAREARGVREHLEQLIKWKESELMGLKALLDSIPRTFDEEAGRALSRLINKA